MRQIGVSAALLIATVASAAGKPNVMVILVDDMGYSDLGCYGGEIDTPALNSLAGGGLRFTQFYNTAKCSQTRAALLSGIYHDEVGVMKMRNCWTLAEATKRAGYFTLMAGKWHLNGEPTRRGFDRYFGHLSGATDFFRGDNTFRLNGKPFQVPATGFYTTDADTDYAIRFIDESRMSGKPFFAYVAYNAPHYPLQAPKEDVMKYRGKYAVGWDVIRERRYAKQRELGLLDPKWGLPPRPDNIPAWDSLPAKKRDLEDLRMATYAGMIDRVDRNVGRLVTHLKKRGLFQDTLILFLSDNGACPFDRNHHLNKRPWEAGSHWTYDKSWAHACNTPLRRYKQNQHEGGISTPCIAHWPNGLKAEPGSMNREVGHLVDVMATLLDLTGVQYPEEFNGQKLKPLRGRSLLPALRGEPPRPRGPLYFDFAGKDHALRDGPWKLVKVRGEAWELYNVEADRTESNNLIDKLPEKAAAMKAAWRAWAKQARAGKKKRQPSKPKR